MQRTPTSLASSLGFGGFHSNSNRDAAAPTTSTSHLPASLGIGTPHGSSRSLSERLKLSRNASSSSSTPRSSSHADGLHFANAIPQGRNAGEFGSFPSVPTWGPQGSHASNGLPASSSTGSLPSASASTSSRNFLVPIGATGARQKLSISSASQRRKLNLSEDAKRSTDSPTGAPYDSPLGFDRSSTSLHNIADLNGASKPGLLRSSSVGVLAPPSGPAAPESSHQASRSTLTPAELVQQAAMQRLSSQRIMPAPKIRSASDNFVPARSSSSRPSPFPSAAPTPTVERDQPSYSISSPSPATDKRADPAPLPPKSASAATPSAAVTTPVPEPSVSSLRSDPRREVSAAPALVNAIPRQPQVQQPAEHSSIPSKPLTLAETYKRAMLERDAERAKVAARHAPAVSPKPASSPDPASAPTLDLNLPSSSFFFDDDTVKTKESSATHSPAPPITSYTYSNASPRVQDHSEQQAEGRSQSSTMPTQDGSSRRIAALSSATTPQRGIKQPSLQKSYDDAMAIQHRIRSGSNDEPVYGGLFDSNVEPFAKQVKDKDTARSYLALRDEDEDAATAASKQGTFNPAPSSQQIKHDVTSVPVSAPVPIADTPQTPPADKSFVQLTTPEQERSKQSVESPLPSQELASSFQGVQRSPRVAELSDGARPAIPREISLKTLRSPPNKLESSPGPREEAALQAGAIAAATTSPILSGSETSANTSANASKPSSRASPAINGEQEGAEVAKWRRSQEALATFSPLQQSRFSEASTDFSDSRAPTRNENRYSGRASSISSNDGLEEESGDGQLLPASAWHEVENALRRFRDKASSAAADRGNLLRAILLPFLALEAETATVDVIGNGPYVKGKARRALFFDWIRSLLLELQHVQTSADRGAILESIACIIESRNFSASILSADPEDEARFSSVFGHILSYAIGELNKKGVYQNTLIFSGRLLAVAFFRVNGVASKLLRALPVNRFALERVAREFEWQRKRPHDFERFANRFPATLRQLCYKDSRDYLKMLDSETVAGSANGLDSHGTEDDRFLVCQPEVEVEMSGNWLRRWQSDDSELFFSFCRSYHRQLASLFASSKSLESVSKYFFGGPGYAHLATCIHQKCLALVHRVILSVTTLSSQKNFNPAGETANVLSGSTAGKPRILEAANRRCTAIVVDIVRAPAGTNMIFAPMLGLHIKALIKRTSLYDVQGVFCLLDWLDGVISHMDSNDLIGEGLIDVSFIITTIGMLLENADHALALMRTIAFCYANFGVLTATSENRIYFCEQILLKPSVFHKLFLSWSFTIRAYYLHLLVFRLARIRDFPSPKDDPSGRTAVRVVRLFSQRLELLRRRHDLLSPEIDSSSDGTKSEDGKSRKSGTSTFVSTIKRASTDGGASSEGSVEGRPKAEKIMGMTAVDPSISSAAAKSGGGEGKKSSHSKTKSWLKAFRSSSKQDIKSGSGNSPRAVQAISPTTGKLTSATESDDDSKTIGSSRTTPRTSFESASSDNMSDVSTLAGSIRGGKTSKSSSAFEFDIKQQQQQRQQQQQQQQSQQQSQQASQGNGANAHDAGIAKDTVFDLQSTHAQHLPTPGRTPQSPRISRAFSRRASMLPGPASELVAGTEGEDEQLPPMPDLPAEHFGLGLSGMNGNTSSAEVYSETLHIYAVQSLREYEQTVQEHDEFFASLPAEQSTQVPRLPVNWPAMWSSNGE